MEGKKLHTFPTQTLFLCFLIYPTILASQSNQLLPILETQLQTYIVHVQKPHNAHLLSDQDLVDYHKSFLPTNLLNSGEPRHVYSYRHVISGFTARLTQDEVLGLELIDGFLYAHPDEQLSLSTTYTPSFLQLDQPDGIWSGSNQGEGIIIGLIDSGIIPTHPSFKDDGTLPPPPAKWKGRCDFNDSSVCNNKIIGAMAFKRGRHPSPLDTFGHGTHTAPTAAGSFVQDANVLGNAKGTASGIAPRAHLAIYKACCDDSDILAGIDKAIDDGVDVLSISIQRVQPRAFYEDTIAMGTFRAAEKGIFASCAAGNKGPFPHQIFNYFPWMLTVGASSVDRRMISTVKLANGMELQGESAYQPTNFISTMFPIYYAGTEASFSSRVCQAGSLDNVNVTGKIVVCEIGGYYHNVWKSQVVKKAGGAGAIIINRSYRGFTTRAETHLLPACHLSRTNALKLISYYEKSINSTSASATPMARFIFKGTRFGARPSPAVAAFSSRGPSTDNGGILKPDIVGPGSNILAAWPTELGPNPLGSSAPPFNFFSGTSLATPHLAGVAALIKASHPDWSPAAIKSAIMTTANSIDCDGNPIADEAKPDLGPANLFALGAGHVNPQAAIDPGLIYDIKPKHYTSYLCDLYDDYHAKRIINQMVNCSTVHGLKAEHLNYPSISVTLNSSVTKGVTVSRIVTNVGEANSEYTVKIDKPKGLRITVSPSKLRFSKLNEKKKYTMKFSIKSPMKRFKYLEGQLAWVSDNYQVRSPLSIHII